MSFNDDSDSTVLPDYLLDSVSLLSKKWHPAIVRCLADTTDCGFSDIEDQLDGISAKVLTDALSELQAYEIIERREVSQSPLRVSYILTERGEELNDVIASLADWGETHLAEPETERVVLVAEDNARVNEMHTAWLEKEYTVRTARDGEETLQRLDSDVGVVVLDRRMPALSGDEILDWIRSQQYDIRVVMATSEDVDFELLDMAFDDYLTKPIEKEKLLSVTADLFERREYDAQLQEYLALLAKLALLQVEYSPERLASNDDYRRLQSRLDELEPTSDDLDDVDSKLFERLPVENLQ